MAEAEALREGVRLILTGTQQHVVAEMDAQELASLWKNRSTHRSEVATILHHVEEMAATFTSFDVVYARRTANFAAHLCAKHALVSLQDYVWHTPPSFLQQCL